jgi:UDP-glucose:glycoprotein glucosyltransferase
MSLISRLIPPSSGAAAELGVKSTQLVMDSQVPLDTLTYLSQNFPKYATAIARRVRVNQSLETEALENNMKAQPGVNIFWMNGAQIDEKDINPLR